MRNPARLMVFAFAHVIYAFLCVQILMASAVSFTIQIHQFIHQVLQFFLGFQMLFLRKKSIFKDAQIILLACWCFIFLSEVSFALHVPDR